MSEPSGDSFIEESQVDRRPMSDETLDPREEEIEETLRPTSFEQFIGQEVATENLGVFIEAARRRSEALDHVLLYGPPGLGKTTLAHIIANELESDLKKTSGPALERPGDLAAILTNLTSRSVLFIDEIHRLSSVIEEFLYPAMEDQKIDITIGEGASARSRSIPIEQFTLVGATTRAGLLTKPLHSRFGVRERLHYYESEQMKQIVTRSARILEVEIDSDGSEEIACRSRGTPRIANRLLRRVRDFAEVLGSGAIDREIAEHALERLEVDQMGLSRMDRTILNAIIHKFDGGPVGIDTLATSVSEEPGTIEELHEPFLIQSGLLKRTPRGRVTTSQAQKHLNSPSEDRPETLF